MRILFFFSCFLACFWLPGGWAINRSVTPREFIIDTDVGVDDAIAIMYLLKRQDIKVKAITIEGDGNARCKPAFENTMNLLSLMHRTDIPVACGREVPFVGGHAFPASVRQKLETFADSLLPKSHAPFPQQNAKKLLIATLRSATHPMDILAIGPLTTLSEVFDAQPELKNKVRMIYQMGGAVYVPGNIMEVDPTQHNRRAEWNIYFDPYAANKVFHAGIPITLVPLDVTNQVLVDTAFYARIQRSYRTAEAELVYKLLTQHKQWLLNKTWYFWDPMAAVIASDETVANCQEIALSVRLYPESLSGATVVDKQHGAPIRVCTKIEGERFKSILLQGLNSGAKEALAAGREV